MGAAGALGGIGDIIGLIGGISQQNKENAAISGLGGNLNSILQLEGTDAGKLLQQYTGVTLPELQNMVSTLAPEQQQAFNNAMSAFTSVGANRQALTNNPYLSQMGQIATQLNNWHGLKPQELNALQMQAGNAALSAANTMKQQIGGVANPALLEKQLANQAGQTAAGTAVNIGAQAAEQELGAREAAGQLVGQQGQQYLSGNEAAGQLGLGQGQGYSGLSSENLNAMLNSLGLQSQAGALGAGMLGQTGQQYGNWLNTMLGYQQQQPNPYGSFFQNIAGIIPSSWSGGAPGGFMTPGSGTSWSAGSLPSGV